MVDRAGTRKAGVMDARGRMALSAAAFVAAAGFLAGCGEEGSSGTEGPATAGSGGCAPVAGEELVALEDDKKLQTADNVVPAVNAKVSTPQLLAALDKASAA